MPTVATAQLLTADFNYPTEAVRGGMEGNVEFEVRLRADGTVAACRLLLPSGNDPLDRQTCRDLRRSARFQPGLDADGRPAPSTYRGRVTWRLPAPLGGTAVTP